MPSTHLGARRIVAADLGRVSPEPGRSEAKGRLAHGVCEVVTYFAVKSANDAVLPM